MLTLLPGVKRAIVIDSVVTGAAVGTIHRFISPLPEFKEERFATSSHGMSVRETIQLANTIGRLPDDVLIIGVEGSNFHQGAPITREVECAARDVIEAILREIAAA
jgi:hydrogenase maturation protease